MKARTKYRCLCPKPDYVLVDITEDVILPKTAKLELAMPLGKDILFWRTATTECSRCGVPLCEDCGVLQEFEGYQIMSLPPFCPTCAEVMR